MARFAVTNDEFAVFARETGYVTVAERPLDPAEFPGVDPEPGSLVFTPPPARSICGCGSGGGGGRRGVARRGPAAIWPAAVTIRRCR